MKNHKSHKVNDPDFARNRLAAIVESSDDAIISKDLNGIVTSWNKGAEHIFGYTAEEMLGTSILRLFPPEREGEEKYILDKIKKGEEIDHFETVRRTKYGRLIDISVSVSAIKNAAGEIIGASKIARDITERKAHQEEVLRISRLYNALSQINQAIVWTRDREELFEKICRVLVDLGEFSMAWIGKADAEMRHLHPVASWGDHADCLSQQANHLLDDPEGREPVITTIREGKSYISNNFALDTNTIPRDAMVHGAGFKAMAAFPIHQEGKVWGAVLVYSDEIGFFRKKENALLKEAAGDVSFALDFLKQDAQRQQAEAATHESDERYKALFDRSMNCIFLYDFEGNFLDANQAALDLIAYTREDLPTLTLAKLVIEDQLPLAFEVTEEVIRTGHQALPTEFTLRGKDGRRVEVETQSSLLYRDGKPAAIQGIARDLTENKKAVAALRDSEKKFRELVQNMPIALVEHGPDTAVTFANPMAQELIGLSAEEMLGKTAKDPIWDFVREDGSELPLQDYPVNQTLRAPDGKLTNLVVGHRRPDGKETVWGQCNGHTIRNEKGDILQVVVTFVDLTERRRAEEVQARLATAVEQSAESIIITDPTGAIVYVNPAFEVISGYTLTEVRGRNPRLLSSGHHDADYYDQVWAMLKQGKGWKGHFINKSKDGIPYEVDATISAVRDGSGKIVNYVAVQRDVSREMQLEAQFRQSQKMEAFGQLAGGVAHDFNNILAVILLHAGLLKTESNLTLTQLDSASEIEKACERASNLSRQLLLFSRKQTMQQRNLKLKDVVENMTKMLERTLGEHIELELNFREAPLTIYADPGMIDQVLLNLAVNARDAMPKGGKILIETSQCQFDEESATKTVQAQPGHFACLSVSDSGSGISPEVLPRIFEPFFTTKEVGKGTGLGLATVYGIVEQHGGWIDASSEVGQGTTFRIFLPLQAKANEEESNPASRSSIQRGSETILLVEDDYTVRMSLRNTLKWLGYHVLEASTGAEALSVWEQHQDDIHLVLTDLVMPEGMAGTELAVLLLQQNPQLKIIYISGYSSDVVGEDTHLEEGGNFLPKPFSAHELAKIVRECLESPAK